MAVSAKSQAALRTRARRLAMQALYQWDLSGNNLSDIEVQFVQDEDFSKADSEYFHELLHQVPARLDEVEAAVAPKTRKVEKTEPHFRKEWNKTKRTK
mgnify:CR=1 FL=1